MNDLQSFGLILNDAGRIPLLTPEEEILLARRLQASLALKAEKPDGPYTTQERRLLHRGHAARQRMITANLRLVANVCRRFIRVMPNIGMAPEDMMQDGILGLARGVEGFDPERGYKLSTYVYWWIRQGINRGIHTNARTIRIPVNIAEKLFKVTHVQNELRHKLGREPKGKEIAEALGVTEAEYRRYMVIGCKTNSLDWIVTDEGSPIVDLISDGSTCDSHLDDLSDVIDCERVRHIINTMLTDKQRMIVMMHFGIGMEAKTWREIAKTMGVHHEACRCNLQRAIRRIKRELLLSPQVEKPLYKTWTLAAA